MEFTIWAIALLVILLGPVILEVLRDLFIQKYDNSEITCPNCGRKFTRFGNKIKR